jgi:hypothetical protein
MMSKPPCPDKPVNPFIVLIALPIALLCTIVMYIGNLKLHGTSLKRDD